MPGGCIFIAAANELDDQPGAARDYLVASQRDWMATLAKAARLAIDAGHFCADVEPDQFAFELYALMLGYHHAQRLLRDPSAEKRLRSAFDHLLTQARV